MATVRISAQAVADFDAILEKLRRLAGARVAERYELQFEAEFDRMREFPGIGSPRSRYGPETHMCLVHPYLIFYDGGPDSETVRVLRILDGRRRITRRMIASVRE